MKNADQFQFFLGRPVEDNIRRNCHLPKSRAVHRDNGRADERTLQKEIDRTLNAEEFTVSGYFACKRNICGDVVKVIAPPAER